MRRREPEQTANTDRRSSRQRCGDAAEAQALQFLERAGLQLVEKNFRCRGGEIDLIMRAGTSLVFVEVRSRASLQFGGALASVTPAKQAKLLHAAQVYLLRLPRLPACRFDLVAIDRGHIQWLQNVIVT